MNYDEFVNRVIKQDSRNYFEKSNLAIGEIPKELHDFYNRYNPVDVEIVLKNLTAIKFYPLEEAKGLQKEYNLNKGFVFATLEGDPVYILEGKVVTCAHGSIERKSQVLAKSFEEFISNIMKEMKGCK